MINNHTMALAIEKDKRMHVFTVILPPPDMTLLTKYKFSQQAAIKHYEPHHYSGNDIILHLAHFIYAPCTRNRPLEKHLTLYVQFDPAIS